MKLYFPNWNEMKPGTCSRPALLVVAISLALLPASAKAIDVQFNFVDTGGNPGFDPDGSRLQTLFDFAESFYEDVFPGGTFQSTVSVTYAELDPSPAIGLYTPIEQMIRIDPTPTSMPWFVDDITPGVNEGFNVQQVFWRDLTPAEKAEFFVHQGPVDVPDTFEVGYSTPPPTPGNEASQLDLLSTVMHEVGHVLGLAYNVGETLDTAYDFDVQWVHGAELGAKAAFETIGNVNIAHLEADRTLMFPIARDRRQLPSHTDLMAMAASLEFDSLDLPRREYYGGGWNNNSSWSGNARPEADDEAFVRTGTASVTQNAVASTLHVLEGAGVVISPGVQLTISEDLDVQDLNSRINLSAGSVLAAQDAAVGQQGELRLNGGQVVLENLDLTFNGELLRFGTAQATVDVTDTLRIFNGSEIAAFDGGTMTLNVGGELINDGQIRAVGGSTLQFESVAQQPWNLDGSNDVGTGTKGALVANGGHIVFATGQFEGGPTFRGTMEFDAGGSIVMPNEHYQLSGDVAFNGDGALSGGGFNLTGNIDVHAGDAQINALIDLFPTGDLNVHGGATVDINYGLAMSGGTLDVDAGGIARIYGGSTITDGILDIEGKVMFFGPATLALPDVIGLPPTVGELHFAHQTTPQLIQTSVIEAGTQMAVHALIIDGPVNGGRADVVIHGADIRLGRLRVGEHRSGFLLVDEGAQIEIDWNGQFGGPVGNGGLRIGSEDQGHGQMIVTGVQDGVRTTVDVYGRISIADGSFGNTGHLTVSDGALVHTDAVIAIGSQSALPNYTGVGTVIVGGSSGGYDAELSAGRWIQVRGSEFGDSTLTINDGGRVVTEDLVVWRGAEVIQNGGELHLKNFDLTSHDGSFVMTGGTLHVENFDGDFSPTGGVVAPGNSPGIMTIAGDFTPTSGAILEIELAGPAGGTQYDQLIVTGAADLGGDLDVQLLDGFLPQVGDLFAILFAGDVSGQFDSITVPEVGGLRWELNYGANNVILEALAAVEGDFDFDGDVDGEDLTGPVTGLMSRFGNDVGGRDFLGWQRELGSGPAAATSLTAVPEPTALMLLGIGFATLLHASRARDTD